MYSAPLTKGAVEDDRQHRDATARTRGSVNALPGMEPATEQTTLGEAASG